MCKLETVQAANRSKGQDFGCESDCFLAPGPCGAERKAQKIVGAVASIAVSGNSGDTQPGIANRFFSCGKAAAIYLQGHHLWSSYG